MVTKKKKKADYNHHSTAYKGKDSREGRLKDIKTDKGTFRMKDNRRDE